MGLYWGYIKVILGLYWGYIGIILGLYWHYIGVILGLYIKVILGLYIGIMEKKMETTMNPDQAAELFEASEAVAGNQRRACVLAKHVDAVGTDKAWAATIRFSAH